MILPNPVTGVGALRCHALRLRRGTDLLPAIRRICLDQSIAAGAIVSAVGCLSAARIRDAGGVRIHELAQRCEILSLSGTVSLARCHLHISLSREDLSVIGGHLCEGCIVNTTCELIIAELPGLAIETEFDDETGYHELVFQPLP